MNYGVGKGVILSINQADSSLTFERVSGGDDDDHHQSYVVVVERDDNFMWMIGKLRLIEDTDICVYSKKPADEASNQLWDFQNVTDDGEVVRIFSYSNNDWVLDIQFNGRGDRKLVLAPRQPFDDESQRWVFVPTAIDGNDDAALSGDMPSFEVAPIRVDAYKASHQLVFLEGNPHLRFV